MVAAARRLQHPVPPVEKPITWRRIAEFARLPWVVKAVHPVGDRLRTVGEGGSLCGGDRGGVMADPLAER